ncbi:hypothetical protein VIBNISFn118_30065 [Vibrio nigripulchritudo SFn118]|nr:hypothetical protein VIBNISFn118_30065 [Vibrio nigripulchritudo SFn118]
MIYVAQIYSESSFLSKSAFTISNAANAVLASISFDSRR